MFNDFWEKMRLGISYFIVGAVAIAAVVTISLILFSNLDVLLTVVILLVVIYAIGHIVYKRNSK